VRRSAAGVGVWPADSERPPVVGRSLACAVSDALIENPILNSPFRMPTRHWKFGDTGIENEVLEGRRASAYFTANPASKIRGPQLQIETQWTRDRIEENTYITQVRERVGQWDEVMKIYEVAARPA
jgi:hypothetical protein